jgi:hypothetical protein
LWTIFSPCSVSCGGGSQTRYRYCSDPPAIHGGLACSGNSNETQNCNTAACPIGKKKQLIHLQSDVIVMTRVFCDRQKCDPQFVQLSDPTFVRPTTKKGHLSDLRLKMRHLSDPKFVRPDICPTRRLSDPTFVRPDVCPTRRFSDRE